MADDARMKSKHLWAKAISVLVRNHSVGMNRNRNDIFLNFNGILELSLAIKKLLKPNDLVINNFFLGLELSFKNHIPVVVTHDWNWSFAKRGDVDAVASLKLGRVLVVHA